MPSRISPSKERSVTLALLIDSLSLFRQVFPLHELPALEKLQRNWVRAFLSPQPLDDICKYFGVKITMYFAWLGHYTTALIVPAAVGVIFWVCICYVCVLHTYIGVQNNLFK